MINTGVLKVGRAAPDANGAGILPVDGASRRQHGRDTQATARAGRSCHAEHPLRGFFTGAGFPLFVLTVVACYELFLLAIIFAPEGGGWWSGFSREFKIWCFDYDVRTGGMEWAAVWVMLAEPFFIGMIAAFLWRRGLAEVNSLRALIAHGRTLAAAIVVAAAAVAGLLAYGKPAADADVLPPFPGERIRTQLTPPDFSFEDQRGRPFVLEELRGRVVLVTGIYALCGTTCPEILVETRRTMDSLPEEARTRLSVVALSLNPEYDTADLMGRIADAYGFSYPEFRYLNGEPGRMNDASTRLGFARTRNAETGVIDHANLFLLIDANGEIAYRFTLQPRHQAWLREAILALTAEAL